MAGPVGIGAPLARDSGLSYHHVMGLRGVQRDLKGPYEHR
jgi:hypothetical protein